MSASAIYQGWVAHRRFGEAPHSFRYRIFMPLFDLEELPRLLDRVPLWSARHPAPARFQDQDYLPGGDGPLMERARDLVQARLGRRPHGSVQLLANPRYAGVGFNPLSLVFLQAGDGSLDSVIAEVTNTPWGERVAYALDARGRGPSEPVEGTFEKRMHVSPFQSMNQTYEISVTPPADGLTVSIKNLEQGRRVFAASMSLHRAELTPRRLLRLVLAHPPMTMTTLARIYANAVRLRLRGAEIHPHAKARPEVG